MVAITLRGTEVEAAKHYLEMMAPPPGFAAKVVDAGVEVELPKPVAELEKEGLEWLRGLVASGSFACDEPALTAKKPRSWLESLMVMFGI